MKKIESLDPEYFNKVYAANEDPWDFETSEYEAKKYLATIEALPKKKFTNALEIGCSIGILTRQLSLKCESLLATDVSKKALDKAILNCEKIENVTFKKAKFPQELPQGPFDLIVVSEVAYYLSLEDWNLAMGKFLNITTEDATILLCHWLPEVHDYPQTGDEVHDSFSEFMNGKMKNIFETRAENYRIDVWEKVGSS